MNISEVIRLIRPWDWLKNGFVFVGILFSERLSNLPLLYLVFMTFIAFCLASSAVYVFNDIVDVEGDRKHPRKKNRPLAKGTVTIRKAYTISFLLCITSVSLGYFISSEVAVVLILYLLLNCGYSLYFKHIVILDVFCISAGFMLRILAGTIGVGIPPSKWLLLCGMMVTLFLGSAKRRAEIISLSQRGGDYRRVLQDYGPVLLDEMIAICASGVIITYSLYTTSLETIEIHHTENLVYTVPFVIYALFRYIFLLHHENSGGDPSRDLLKDRHIIVSVLGWALTMLILTWL